MRPAYLAITGYLIAFLGQRRANFEARIRELESSAERERIARSLHDGYVQALASFNLRLAACQQLLSKHRETEALTQLTELRLGVAREYDEVRSYLRTLVNLDQQAAQNSLFGDFDTRFAVEMAFTASGVIVEHIFQVVLEGIRNAWRHGKARSAGVKVIQTAGVIRIAIDDDGTGFGGSDSVPWAIASRVAEFGGNLTIKNGSQPGAHLEILMPAR
jgi:signal transduction histidine kinase